MERFTHTASFILGSVSFEKQYSTVKIYYCIVNHVMQLITGYVNGRTVAVDSHNVP